MGFSEWFTENWVNIATAVSGIGGLWAAVFAIRKDTKARIEDTKARKVANLLTITANHRELWKECLTYRCQISAGLSSPN